MLGIGVAFAGIFAVKELVSGAVALEQSTVKLRTQLGLTAAEAAKVRQQGQELATTYGVAAEASVDAGFAIQSAGLRGAEAAEALEAATKGAAIGLGEARDIGLLSAAAMTAWGSESLSATRSTEILAAAVKAGNLEASELAGSLGQALAPASTLGIEFEELAGAVAFYTRFGVSASEATTAVRGAMSQMLKPSQQAKTVLEGIGMTVDDLQKMVGEQGLTATLQHLRNELGDDQEAFARVIGRAESLSFALAVTGEGAKDMDQIMRDMRGSSGALDEAWRIQAETAGTQLAVAWQTVKNAAVDLTTQVLPSLVGGISEAIGFVQDIFASDAQKQASDYRDRVEEVGAKFTALGRTDISRQRQNLTASMMALRGAAADGSFAAFEQFVNDVQRYGAEGDRATRLTIIDRIKTELRELGDFVDSDLTWSEYSAKVDRSLGGVRLLLEQAGFDVREFSRISTASIVRSVDTEIGYRQRQQNSRDRVSEALQREHGFSESFADLLAGRFVNSLTMAQREQTALERDIAETNAVLGPGEELLDAFATSAFDVAGKLNDAGSAASDARGDVEDAGDAFDDAGDQADTAKSKVSELASELGSLPTTTQLTIYVDTIRREFGTRGPVSSATAAMEGIGAGFGDPINTGGQYGQLGGDGEVSLTLPQEPARITSGSGSGGGGGAEETAAERQARQDADWHRYRGRLNPTIASDPEIRRLWEAEWEAGEAGELIDWVVVEGKGDWDTSYASPLDAYVRSRTPTQPKIASGGGGKPKKAAKPVDTSEDWLELDAPNDLERQGRQWLAQVRPDLDYRTLSRIISDAFTEREQNLEIGRGPTELPEIITAALTAYDGPSAFEGNPVPGTIGGDLIDSVSNLSELPSGVEAMKQIRTIMTTGNESQRSYFQMMLDTMGEDGYTQEEIQTLLDQSGPIVKAIEKLNADEATRAKEMANLQIRSLKEGGIPLYNALVDAGLIEAERLAEPELPREAATVFTRDDGTQYVQIGSELKGFRNVALNQRAITAAGAERLALNQHAYGDFPGLLDESDAQTQHSINAALAALVKYGKKTSDSSEQIAGNTATGRRTGLLT